MESGSNGRPRAQMQKREAQRLAEEDAARAAQRSGEREIVEDSDELLDEIDALLEEQSVLTQFRQKGGQ
jgi:Pup-like protein